MKVDIRRGREADLPAVLELIRELALFEKAPQEVTNTVEMMKQDGFGKNPVFKLLVAETEGQVVGIAVYFFKYSTWKGKGIYLDDIVVKESLRGQGIGRKLFDEVLEECKRNDCKQLHWQVLDWNEPAINFYKKYNASFDGEWVNCKLHF